jgi:hypothetical protein
MIWKDLKNFCNNLTEEQLEQKVLMWRETEVISDINAMKLCEDYYIEKENPEEGCFPASECQDLPKETKVKKVYNQGTPILMEDF